MIRVRVGRRAPKAEQIIAAVGAHRAAQLRQRAEQFATGHTVSAARYDAQQELHALNTELSLPTEHDVRQIVDMRDPVEEYLLVWLDLADADEGGGWRARDPFGLDPSLMLQHLVSARMRVVEPLAEAVGGLTEVSDEKRNESLRKAGDQVRRAAETRLVRGLGSEIRLHPDMLELLLGLEEAAARGTRAAVEGVAQEAFRAYEHLCRRLVLEYPPPRPVWARNTTPHQNVCEHLRDYASELGLLTLPEALLGERNLSGFARNLARLPDEKTIRKICEAGFARSLVPYALVAAADPRSPHRSHHPLRGLAGRRPGVFNELFGLGKRFGLSDLRNRGAHAQRDPSVADDIEWCRGLALDAARTALEMSPQSPERITS